MTSLLRSIGLRSICVRSILASSAVLLGATCVHAQWTSDASVNTIVSGAGTDNTAIQAKTRLAARSDGGNYITWWQSEDAPIYWSLRMNRLDQSGQKAWPSDLVVSNKNSSTTQGVQLVNSVDYDLKTDDAGNAILAFTDFRTNANRNVHVYRISPTGQMLWGVDGVAITTDATFKRDPRIVQTSDGMFAVAWYSQGNFTSIPPSLRLQVLDDTGSVKLPVGGIALATATTNSRPPDRFELVASNNGTVIAAWIKEFSTSSSANKWVVAQKFGPSSDTTTWEGKWNSGTPITVSDQPVPVSGTYPRVALQASAEGGCVLAWHDQRAGSGLFNVFAQRLDNNGAAMWPANGLAVSAEAARIRQEPSLAFDATTNSTWIAWREIDNAQGLRGVYAQRFDSAGTRTLSDTGKAIAELSASAKSSVRLRVSGPGAIVAWFDDLGSAPAGQTIGIGRMDQTGALTWEPTNPVMCSTVSVKNFVKHPLDTTPNASIALDGLSMTASYPTGIVVAWQDARTDAADLFAQRIATCGSLARSSAADFDANGAASIDDIFIYLNAWFAQNPRCDVDGVDGLSIDDLFVFINLWFAGC